MKNNRIIYILFAIIIIWLLTISITSQNKTSNEETTVVNQYNISGFSTDFTSIVENNKSSIVTINADGVISSGSIYVENEGKAYIISTYHGVSGAHNINVVFDSGYSTNGKILGFDIFADLAIIEIEIPFETKAIKTGDALMCKPGEFIISIGTPISLEYKGSVDLGMISSKVITIENNIKYDDKFYSYYLDVIELSSNLQNGYSGAPVINMNGEVIGMVTMAYKENMTFALPINEIRIIADKIIDDEEYSKTQFGIKGQYIGNMENYQKTNLNISINIFEGLYVEKLNISSLAYTSGIRSGDIITSINGVDLIDNMSLLNFAYSNETNFEFKVIRNNEEIILTGTAND